MELLDRKGPLPLYYQIAENLRSLYRESEAGTRLPSEPELAKRFGVSRGTIKQALDELEREGLIERVRGLGTFVTQPRIRQPGTRIQSYTEQITVHGYQTFAQVLNLRKQEAGSVVGNKLDIAYNEQVYWIERLRYIGKDPMVLISSYVPLAMVGELTEGDVAESLYAFLDKRGLRPTKTCDSFMANVACRSIAKVLGIVEGAAVLCSDRVGFANGRPVEYSRSIIRAKDYVLTIESEEAKAGSVTHRRGFSLSQDHK